jgi:hypothetical protein
LIALTALLIQAIAAGASGPYLIPRDRNPHDVFRDRLYEMFSASVSAPAPPDVPWRPGDPVVRFAPASSRYNRIEALSLAAVAGTETGNGRTLAAIIRLGGADLVPNAEVEFVREKPGRVVTAAVYHRLAAANDWGNPLALGASLGALFIGRDDGFYYRTGGAELTISDTGRVSFSGRLFVERHRSARVKNDFALSDIFGERRFMPNIDATDGYIAGAEVTLGWWRGELATEPRMFTVARIEGAVGDFDYSRFFVDISASTPVLNTVLAGLTVAAGTSGGAMPVQRAFIMGGSRSARGQRAGVMFGNGFWMSQAEIGTLNTTVRPVLFFDVAWAGDRKYFFDHPGPIATGAGLGLSFFDGSLRFDLARGLRPGRSWRGALYLEALM